MRGWITEVLLCSYHSNTNNNTLLLPLVAQRMYVRLCVFMPVCKPLRLLVRVCLSVCSLVCVCGESADVL